MLQQLSVFLIVLVASEFSFSIENPTQDLNVVNKPIGARNELTKPVRLGRETQLNSLKSRLLRSTLWLKETGKEFDRSVSNIQLVGKNNPKDDNSVIENLFLQAKSNVVKRSAKENEEDDLETAECGTFLFKFRKGRRRH